MCCSVGCGAWCGSWPAKRLNHCGPSQAYDAAALPALLSAAIAPPLLSAAIAPLLLALLIHAPRDGGRSGGAAIASLGATARAESVAKFARCCLLRRVLQLSRTASHRSIDIQQYAWGVSRAVQSVAAGAGRCNRCQWR